MQHEEHTSHTHPGFGSNSGGWGIAIVAISLVAVALIAWNLWNHGSKEVDHYRLPQTESKAAHSESKPAH